MTPCPCCGHYPPVSASMQKKMLDYITANPGAKRAAIMADLEISSVDCSNWLNRIKAQRLVHATGRGPMARWFPGERTVPAPRVNSVWAMAAN
jgi:hypothetical protein